MSVLGSHFELEDLGGGLFRHTQYMKAIAYQEGGLFRRINNDWQQGDVTRPHIITAAPFMVSIAPDGHRRIHPTRELDRYFEFGAPYIKPGGTWQKANLGQAIRKGNSINWQTANADMRVLFAGHYVKLDIELKNGWIPPGGQLAFPVGLTGLTRQGGQILADGKLVMSVRAPVVYDDANLEDMRPIAHDFVQVGGQWYALFTLPSLVGMARPVVDPTLTLQPDATDGIDAQTYATAATTNYGVSTDLWVGNNGGALRSFLKFNLSALPIDANISSAVLWIVNQSDGGTNNTNTLAVYRQKRAWIETEITWNIYSTGNNWQTAGGFGTNDCEQTDIGSVSVIGIFGVNTKTITLTPTTKSSLDLGNGWMMKHTVETESSHRWSSSDHATAVNRPKLVVEYTLPGGGIFNVSFSASFRGPFG